MNLEEFHTQINLMASEGGASDALIPIAVRHAVQFLERNWSFKYMQGEATLAYLAAAAFPVSLAFGLPRRKTVLSGETRAPAGVDGVNEISIVGTPHVTLDDMEFEDKLPVYVYTDATGETYARPLLRTTGDVDLHFVVLNYTTWPISAYDAFTHVLIDRAEDILASQSLLALSAMNRDEGMAQFYSPKRAEELKSLLRADLLFEDGMEIK